MPDLQKESALLLFSGGQDSGTCLAWALNRFQHVQTVGFAYGQRHSVELACRQNVRQRMAALSQQWGTRLESDTLLHIDLFDQIGKTAMTSEMDIAFDEHGLPNTYVPGRNLLFLVAAAALAWRRGIRHIITGVCETDYSGYPDCRDDAIKAMQLALNTGMNAHFILHTPLMWLDKAETWELARMEGGMDFIEMLRLESHTCYLGERGTLHPWGYGCGKCPACLLRARGWEAFQNRNHSGG